jgi:tetratricopeptide (TPR) repeat protein
MALTGAFRRDLALPFARQEPGAIAAVIPSYPLVRGSLLEEAGDLAAAERSYREALRRDPSQLESAVNLGGVLNAQGSSKEAIAVLDPVIESYPRSEGARRNRALAHLARKDEAAAEADLLEAFRVSPRAPVARLLGQLARARGDAQSADRWAAKAARLEPGPAAR